VSEQNTMIETSTPKLLTNTTMYAIRVGGRYFSSLRDGNPWTTGNPTYFTLEKAQEIRHQILKSDYPEDHVSLITAEKKNNGFWMGNDGEGCFTQFVLRLAPPVRKIYDNAPSWFIEAMRKVSPDSHWWAVTEYVKGTDSDWHGDSEAAHMVFDEQFQSGGYDPWWDHAGWLEDDGQTMLVSEPYAVDAQALSDLLAFVKRCDLDVKIWGCSNHYPGSTMRIGIWPKK
jgi:hypothetical protein